MTAPPADEGRAVEEALVDGEDLSFAGDKRLSGLPREMHRRKSGAPPKPPALWAVREALQYKHEGEWGAYPKGFVAWAARALGVSPGEILHVCSGSLPPGEGRARVDLRHAVGPDVVADGRSLPFADGTFAAVMLDPPYSVEYADSLYGTGYPRPGHLLAEAARVVRPCGTIGLFHFIVAASPHGCVFDRVMGVTTGVGYRIRAFTMYRKEQDGLFAPTEES